MFYGLSIEQFEELSQKPEPLNPELIAHERIDPDGSGIIHHPYMIFEAYEPGCYAVANHWFKMKRDRIETALAAGEWSKAFMFIEKPYYLEIIDQYAGRMSDEDYWSMLAIGYSHMEWLTPEGELLKKLFTVDRPGRSEYLMDEKERSALAAMPEQITIYRGYQRPECRLGWSWTIDFEQAKWFAKRFQETGSGFIASAKVDKSNVIAYWTGRNESEILVLPENLIDVEG